jgi:hypothetical protein
MSPYATYTSSKWEDGMIANNEAYAWSGKHDFSLNASRLKEDTLRILAQPAQSEAMFRLHLPTLCITYADMAFQNRVGGMQENYPSSAAYGPAYFDPPVEIVGEEEIERLTYIRGAQRVTIGPDETLIEFYAWSELVIPRLRIDEKQSANATLSAQQVNVLVEQPVSLKVRQFANGRHIGGINIEARHPAYVESEPVREYHLEIRVIDGLILEPLPEVRVNIWHWDAELFERDPSRGFQLDDQVWTGGDGSFVQSKRPAEELEAVSAYLPGWRITPRCYRPLPGEPVRMHLRAWRMQPTKVRYAWKKRDRLEAMAFRCGLEVEEILQINGLEDPEVLNAGMTIHLPCYAGALWLDSWDTPQDIAKRFRFKDEEMLARINGLRDLGEYDSSLEMQLPGWYFFHAGINDTLETFDRIFGLPDGSCVPAGRTYRPSSGYLFIGEVVGIPAYRE